MEISITFPESEFDLSLLLDFLKFILFVLVVSTSMNVPDKTANGQTVCLPNFYLDIYYKVYLNFVNYPFFIYSKAF